MATALRPAYRPLYSGITTLRSTWEWVRPGLGIDLGTANTVISVQRRGVLVDEPSVIAARAGGERGLSLVAAGRAAQAMLGRAGADVKVIRPVRSGAISDLEPARYLLSGMVRRLPVGPWARWRPRAVIAVPVGASALERQAFVEVADEAGLGHVDLIPVPVAGAIGAGIDVDAPSAHLVVAMGGGTSEIAIFGAGGILASASSRAGGAAMTAAIAGYLRSQHRLAVGEETAEAVKVAGAQARSAVEVRGVDVLTGRPRRLTLRHEEIGDAVAGVLDVIVHDLAAMLDGSVSPQALADVLVDGATVFGAPMQMPALRRRLESGLGLRVRLAESPMHCVALGAAACVGNRARLAAFSA